MNQQPVHMDVLFIMIQGLIDQSDRGHIAPLQFAKEAQPVFRELVNQIVEINSKNKLDLVQLKERLSEDSHDKLIIRNLRHLLSEHLDFIDHMDLRDAYNDFCLAQIKKLD